MQQQPQALHLGDTAGTSSSGASSEAAQPSLYIAAMQHEYSEDRRPLTPAGGPPSAQNTTPVLADLNTIDLNNLWCRYETCCASRFWLAKCLVFLRKF